MAEVKITLDKDETELDAHIALSKALDLQNSGDTHIRESFEDAAMIDASQQMAKVHDDIYTDMMQEIRDALDQEYT